MCNMAAYAGRNAAAPILFRMLQSQEGLGGGHYNGIATIHEGKIYMIKVIGSTADLLRRHPEVLELPGTVGIAHPWRRKWQPTPVFLPGKSHRQRSLAGHSPWGRKRAGHDLETK